MKEKSTRLRHVPGKREHIACACRTRRLWRIRSSAMSKHDLSTSTEQLLYLETCNYLGRRDRISIGNFNVENILERFQQFFPRCSTWWSSPRRIKAEKKKKEILSAAVLLYEVSLKNRRFLLGSAECPLPCTSEAWNTCFDQSTHLSLIFKTNAEKRSWIIIRRK